MKGAAGLFAYGNKAAQEEARTSPLTYKHAKKKATLPY